ncbi:MAG: EutN/CcmL family microcompartment protein [Candidatus Muirbacterium halophilum]|nr:EutN/CcmL family microcompartment protein [Candidatus Muirbacterium halophilum]MCK9475293.1 EutN/CcmL family microcompartment protein [Candidatus Muirbacterium halophilum]
MFLAKVIGNVVSSHKNIELNGKKLLVVKKINPVDYKTFGKDIIAIDTVGAGNGEIVFLVKEGSVAQQLLDNKNVPVHTVILGIVDKIDITEEKV